MTEAQAAWLRKLRDEGPQHFNTARHDCRDWRHCYIAEWADFDANDDDFITPAGLAALAEHEEKGK